MRRDIAGQALQVATEPPIACTLEPDAVPDRLAAWQTILAGAAGRATSADGSVRVELGGDVDVEALARLVADEQRCCSFLAFAITVDHRGVGLEVTAPGGAEEMVTALFGVTD